MIPASNVALPDAPPPTTRLAGVTFRKLGKLHFYAAPDDLVLDVGTHVIAETERGHEFGEVKILRSVSGRPDEQDGARIVRVASQNDARQAAQRQAEAKAGLALCQETADRLRLFLKIVEAEAAWDGSQITFYFVADARVDFRELVKQVARELRVRVHLHQVGSRDHAQQLGGYGPCGRPLCCTTFLRDFAPVSMKMAKDQSLFLNPSKFSGVCGKLMCCLRYEHETYVEARDRLPPIGASVTTPDGERGVINDINFLRETVSVTIRDNDGARWATFPAADVVVARACGDCGSAGGGCGGACGSGDGAAACAAPAKSSGVITLEHRLRKNGQR